VAKSKIPKSARRSLKRAFVENDSSLSDSKVEGIRLTRKAYRSGIETGEIKRTKITWTVSVGDLVKIKPRKKNEPTLYGIVTYKKNRINYSNQEDEFIIVMTSKKSDIKLHPKSVETIQEA
tara:strand:+ start:84 stop:446 length:363 start_codon:yes stop_codon:yes gene_type:complete